MARRVALGVGAALAALVVYLLAWPVAVDPVAWEAPVFDPAAWSATGTLADVERIALADGHGPEDLEVDSEGRIYAGLADGRILRWRSSGAQPDVLAHTGGRPLGLHWDREGRLLVADAQRGLLRIDPHNGASEVLATTCAQRPLVFADDLETTADGRVWLTDASEKFSQPDWKLDLLENGANGRLCVWRPDSGSDAEEVLGGLHFANGVAVDPAAQFVLVNETSRYRVRKIWIAGPRAGTHEVVIDNLPGFPDGISTGSGGRFWIALASPRNPLVDAAAGSPWLRRVMVRLPAFLQPAPERTARTIGIDASGRVLHDLVDPHGTRIAVVTSVQERAGWLYLGSLTDTAWGRVVAPALEAPPAEPR